MDQAFLLAVLDPAGWASAHPLATLALLACVAVGLARGFFLYTRAFLDRFEELPDPRSLSTPELVVLANPRELSRAQLERLERRWRTAGRGAALVAVGTLALVGARTLLARDVPRAEALALLDAERTELVAELDQDERLAPDLAPARQTAGDAARAAELAGRLERSLERIATRSDRADFAPEEEARLELASCALARARGSLTAVLDLVPEDELQRAEEATDARMEHEAALLVERARALRGLGEARRAIPLLERATALRPQRLDVALDLAQDHLVCGQLDSALGRLSVLTPALERAISAEGRLELGALLVRARALEGQARAERGEVELALEAYSRALELMQRGDLFEPSARLDDDLARILRARALVALRTGRADEARLDLERALALRRALTPDPSDPVAAAELAQAVFEHARALALAGDPRAALAELDEARALAARAPADELGFEAADGRAAAAFVHELELARVRALQALGELERAHELLDEQIEALDAAPGNDALFDRLRADAALLHAGFGLAARAPELALADLERAFEHLAREAGRGAHQPELEELLARANELRALAEEQISAPEPAAAIASATVAASEELLADESPDAPPPAPVVLAADVSAEPVPATTACAQPDDAPTPPAAPDELEQLDLRLAAWELELAAEEDPRVLAAPVADLLARAELLAARGESERSVADLDRAVQLLHDRLGVETPDSASGREAALELARALGLRGAERARQGRFALAFRDFDERVGVLGGREALARDAQHAHALADALRERGLVAFNQRDREAALADLDAAVALVESWLSSAPEELADAMAVRLEGLRRERTLVDGGGSDGR